MNKDMIFAYFIMLSTNMWGEPGAYAKHGPWRDHFMTDEATWRRVIDYLPECGFNTLVIDLGDAIQYESHPEISIPGAWSKDKLKQELDHIRSIGLTPIPKLNFSFGHHAWLKEYSRRPCTPEYYKVVEDLIREVAELFGYPKLFHLGMDEEWMVSKDKRPENLTIIRPKRIWWHDINFEFDICDKVGARPWVWADDCWNDPVDYCANMSKGTLQSNWYYTNFTSYKNPDGSFSRKEIETYRVLEKAGFDQVPTSSALERWRNIRETMEVCNEIISPEHLKGYMTASWYFTFDRHVYGLLNEAQIFKYAKKAVFPET